MSIKFAGGFLPYIYTLDPNGFEGNQIGSQRLFFVTVKNDSIALLKHEEQHIKQFYFIMMLVAIAAFAGHYFMMPVVGYVAGALIISTGIIDYVDFRKEATAYATSVEYGRSLESAVSALSTHPYAKGDQELARKAITGGTFLGLF